MARIVVTGGAGFIGGALRRGLPPHGHSVVLADIRPDAELPADVTEPADCSRVCAGADVVIHGAAIHRADEARRRTAEMIRTNVQGTWNLLDAAAAAGVGRVVLLSSAKVYGDAREGLCREDDWLVPTGSYGLTKLAAESLARRAHAERGLDVTVLRPFSVYGPGQDLDTGYVGMLLKALRDGGEALLPGAPDYRRDFVHVDDLVTLCARVLDAPRPGFSVFNAGSGRLVSLETLARLMAEAGGRELAVAYREPPDGTLRHSGADMARAERELGFTPAVTLEAGLRETVAWLLGPPAGSAAAAR